LGNLKERGHVEDLGLDERVTLKCVLQKWKGWLYTVLTWHRVGPDGGLL